jgi:L-lactate dehydrogenase (cytochrome)
MVDMSGRSLTTTMAGHAVSMPLALAPTGLCGMQHADGEILAAQAAEAAGVPFTLSTMSICSIEDVAAATTKPFWFQLYVMRDRGFVGELIDRAKAAGCGALVLTLDLQILGQRHKDLRNALSAPPRLTPKHLWQMARRRAGAWACSAPGAASSATWSATSRASATCPRWARGPPSSSIRACRGTTWHGSSSAGAAR